MVESAVLHAPTPSQVEAVVTFPAAQVAGAQTAELSGKVQVLPLVPSH
jgi:hypothetical protein